MMLLVLHEAVASPCFVRMESDPVMLPLTKSVWLCRFLLQSLEDLDTSLRKLNSRLFVVRGQPTDVFPRLFKVSAGSERRQWDSFCSPGFPCRLSEMICPRKWKRPELDSLLLLKLGANAVWSACQQNGNCVKEKNSVKPVSCWKVPSSVQTWAVTSYSTPDATGFFRCFLGLSQQDLLGFFLHQKFKGEVSCLTRGVSCLSLLCLLGKKAFRRSLLAFPGVNDW